VAFEVAKQLRAPLDVLLVRKLGLPGHEELAMGALADGDVVTLNDELVNRLAIPDELIDDIYRRERKTIRRQRQLYRGGTPPLEVKDHVVILVDDGLATGSTMKAAVAALRKQRPKRLIVAVPVGANETCAELREEVDEVVCAMQPQNFTAVGLWYEDFSPTSDATVQSLLAEAAEWQHAAAGQ
jgi:putative phosphoribosyl transferase